ncbi:MAG: DUF1016 domain-containing protein [Bacteroidales bacterium]|jgi:hypothetical protein|nr:DUF1016 domain-containing protein [Bacteroidales bacterium]
MISKGPYQHLMIVAITARSSQKHNMLPKCFLLLCANKDDEVVEYALRCNLSPVPVAEYTAKLPDKKLLQNKLLELID